MNLALCRLTLALLPALALIACTPSSGPATETAPTAAPAESSAATPAETVPPQTAPADVPALDAHHWQLVEASGADTEVLLRRDKPLQLDFSEQGLSVRNLCNGIHASWQAGPDGRVTVSRGMSTLMACDDEGLMAAERRIGELLPLLERYSVAAGDPPQLTLSGADGVELLLHGAPTAATRYGGEGERLFIEVAEEKVSCNHPLMPEVQCLHVRELVFNEAGLREGEPGPWQVLPVPMEGFEHEAGVRSVLRVHRYRLKGVPADAPAVAYVLDLVVERGWVAP